MISPVAALPDKTLFHEIGHVVLGHCEEKALSQAEITQRDVREVEAEAVALLCCESLGVPGAEFSRGYIQEWVKGQPPHRALCPAHLPLRGPNPPRRPGC